MSPRGTDAIDLIQRLRDPRASRFTTARRCKISAVIDAIDSNEAPDLLPTFAFILGHRRASSGLPALIGLLRSDQPHVRQMAADAIGKILFTSPKGRFRAPVTEALLEALDREHDGAVVGDIVAALGATRDPSLVPRISQFLESEQYSVRRAADYALELIVKRHGAFRVSGK